MLPTTNKNLLSVILNLTELLWIRPLATAVLQKMYVLYMYVHVFYAHEQAQKPLQYWPLNCKEALNRCFEKETGFKIGSFGHLVPYFHKIAIVI